MIKKLFGQSSTSNIPSSAPQNVTKTSRKQQAKQTSASLPDYQEATRDAPAYSGSAPKYSASAHAPLLRAPQGAASGAATSRAGGVAHQQRLSQKAQDIGQKAYNERMALWNDHGLATKAAEGAEAAFLKADPYNPQSFAYRKPKQTVLDVWQGQGPEPLVIPKGVSRAEKKALVEQHREASFQAGEAARADAGVQPLRERTNSERDVKLDFKTPWGQKRYHYPGGEYIRVPGNENIVDSDPYNDAY